MELDRARLKDYYDDLSRDTMRRLQKAEDDRRSALEAKLAAIEGERVSKLADVEQKYHLRIQLELINLAIITQPKLDLNVEIRTHRMTVRRRVSWDPLLHVVEGLACDSCGQAGYSFYMCENGHLVHKDCIAPQCVDCKRTYCLKCSHEVQNCIVCDRPVCSHSLKRCKECGRITCHEHNDMCHADNGQPAKKSKTAESVVSPSNVSSVVNESINETGKTSKQKLPAKQGATQIRNVSRKPIEKSLPEVVGDFLDVYSDPAANSIVAYVIQKKRQIATREWRMDDEGILVNCWCEKEYCSKRGLVYRPAAVENLAVQLTECVEEFAREYGVGVKKIHYLHVRQGQPIRELKLKIPAGWKEPEILERAKAGFEALRNRNMKY